jgi:hypothetical protein
MIATHILATRHYEKFFENLRRQAQERNAAQIVRYSS